MVLWVGGCIGSSCSSSESVSSSSDDWHAPTLLSNFISPRSNAPNTSAMINKLYKYLEVKIQNFIHINDVVDAFDDERSAIMPRIDYIERNEPLGSFLNIF